MTAIVEANTDSVRNERTERFEIHFYFHELVLINQKVKLRKQRVMSDATKDLLVGMAVQLVLNVRDVLSKFFHWIPCASQLGRIYGSVRW